MNLEDARIIKAAGVNMLLAEKTINQHLPVRLSDFDLKPPYVTGDTLFNFWLNIGYQKLYIPDLTKQFYEAVTVYQEKSA